MNGRAERYEARGPGGKEVLARAVGVPRRAICFTMVLWLVLWLCALPEVASAQAVRPPPAPPPAGSGFSLQVIGAGARQWHSRLGSASGLLVQATEGDGSGGTPLDAVIRVAPADLLGVGLEWHPAPSYSLSVGGSRLVSTLSVDGGIGAAGGAGMRPFALRNLGDARVEAVELTFRRRWGPEDWLVRPHLEIGAGATRWTLRDLDELDEVSELIGNPVSLSDVRAVFPTATLAAGADVPAGRWVLLRFELSGRITPNPVDDLDFRLGENFAGVGSPEARIRAVRAALAVIVRPG